jgi:hypothetical protein
MTCPTESFDGARVLRRSERLINLKQAKKPVLASLVVHKRTGKHRYIEFKASKKRTVSQFLLVKENELPYRHREALTNTFNVSIRHSCRIKYAT